MLADDLGSLKSWRFFFSTFSANAVNSESECLRRLLESSKWMAYLADAFTEGGEAIIDCYLHDFSHMVYRTQDERELEVSIRNIF